jgi:signal transduction histidine kinase
MTETIETPTRDRRRNVVGLRGVLLVALGAILFESGGVAGGSAGWTLLALHLLSNVLLLALPLRLIRPLKLELVAGGTDVAFIAIAIHLSGSAGGLLPVTCLMMALVVALAGNRWHLACGAAVVVALHGWLTVSSPVESLRQLAPQAVFLSAIAMYFGFLTNGIHRSHKKAAADGLERTELEALLEILDKINSSLDVSDVTRTIVQKLSGIVPDARCSMLRVDESENRCHVIAAHDDPRIDMLELDLARYPEIRRSIETRRSVLIQDAAGDPLMREVQEAIAGLDLHSIMVVPMVFGDDLLGTLCIKAARARYAFTRSEIRFCATVARASANALKNALLHQQVQEESRRLRATHSQLLQAKKLSTIGEVISGVAHELNSPLSGVLGFSELLLLRDIEGQVRQEVELIHDSALRCQKIVKNLLSFARENKPERKYQSVNEVIAKTLEMKSYQLRVHGIETDCELDPGLPWTMLDFHQFQQVLLNLINNAQHALKATGRSNGLRLGVTSGLVDGKIRVEITDNGEGMDGATLERVFDPFFTTREPGRGTGLGLSVSHGIIEEHGGNIRARSTRGEGSTFAIELPPQDRPNAETAEGAQTEGAPLKIRVGSRILAVDDEPIVLQLLVNLFEGRGYKIDTATNGKEAFESAAMRSYDLVITDVRMPEMDGIELYGKLLQRWPELAGRVIFITGDLADGETTRFLAEANAQTLTKPIHITEMVRVVDETLARPAQ